MSNLSPYFSQLWWCFWWCCHWWIAYRFVTTFWCSNINHYCLMYVPWFCLLSKHIFTHNSTLSYPCFQDYSKINCNKLQSCVDLGNSNGSSYSNQLVKDSALHSSTLQHRLSSNSDTFTFWSTCLYSKSLLTVYGDGSMTNSTMC